MAAQGFAQDLNFFAFLADFSALGSPPSSFSAPTFLPLLGQSYLGPNRLFQTLQDGSIIAKEQANNITRRVFIKK
jgi:hypothetical protein